MTTELDTVLKVRMILQDGSQSSLILQDERLGAIVLMPILTKVKNFRECDEKSARFSAMIESSLCTSSSYLIDARASRGRAGIFFCRRQSPSARPLRRLGIS